MFICSNYLGRWTQMNLEFSKGARPFEHIRVESMLLLYDIF